MRPEGFIPDENPFTVCHAGQSPAVAAVIAEACTPVVVPGVQVGPTIV